MQSDQTGNPSHMGSFVDSGSVKNPRFYGSQINGNLGAQSRNFSAVRGNQEINKSKISDSSSFYQAQRPQNLSGLRPVEGVNMMSA